MTLLTVDGLTKRYGGLTAVSAIGFEIAAGQIVGIFGPNGSGKTTLLNLIAGLVPPTAGRLVWKGAEIHRRPTHERAGVGIVKTFQNPLVFRELSVFEHLRIATHLRFKRALGWRRIATLLHRSQAVKCVDDATLDKLGHILALCRLDGQADEPAGNLSYGDEKMLGVAMALMCDPELLLLDEPASGLGQDEVANLDGVLRTLRDRGTTLCIIDHKVDFLGSLADRAIAIHHGCKLAEGTPDVVLRDPQVIAAYLGTGHA